MYGAIELFPAPDLLIDFLPQHQLYHTPADSRVLLSNRYIQPKWSASTRISIRRVNSKHSTQQGDIPGNKTPPLLLSCAPHGNKYGTIEEQPEITQIGVCDV